MGRITPSVFVLASLILGVGGSVAFGEEGAQNNNPTNSATTAARDYTVTIQTDKGSYDPDERIVLKITVKYHGAGTVNFETDPGTVYRNITVLWNKKHCPQTLFCKQAIDNDFNYGHGLRISPGWEGSSAYHLNRLFDMTRTGEYKILVRRVGLEVGPITIQIRDSGLKE